MLTRCRFFVIPLLAALLQTEAVPVIDFDIKDPASNFHFMYHSAFNVLLTVHNYGCYATEMDEHLHDDLLRNFRGKLQNTIEEEILDNDSERLDPITIDEFRNKFGDPLADAYCINSDIYVISIDFLRCDFEKYQTACAWDYDNSQRILWRVQQGTTDSALTGPDGDHTLGTRLGHFVYMEANESPIPGSMAQLKSPMVRVNKTLGMCLRFWYDMHGTDVDTLSVLAEYPSNPGQEETLWMMSKDQGRGWKLAEATVLGLASSKTDEDDVQLTLRATRGHGVYGDISVDDISSSPGVCAPASLNCSFEDAAVKEQFCWGWTQVSNGDEDDIDWTRVRGQATTTNGPNHAFRLNNVANDYYLYLTGHSGAKAELVSNKLHLAGPICLRFFYYMKGPQLGELEVVQVDADGRENIQMSKLAADATTDWTPVNMTITARSPDEPIQLKLRAFRSADPASVIAIDHVSGLSGTCEQYPNAPLIG